MAKDVVWLNENEQRTWRAFLAANAMLEETLDRQLQRNSGMPHAYYIILAMLSEALDQRLRMAELALMVRSSQSRLSHAVSRLEESGWVTRQQDHEDRRGRFVLLTPAGLDMVQQSAPGHVAEVRKRLFDPLTCEQVAQLEAICAAIANHEDNS